MRPFTRVTGRVVPLPRADIDTDQIVPAAHLKRVTRDGYGAALFERWRHTPDGRPDPDFVLNDSRYHGAVFLATGPNFGCGSSREHAVWALADWGFRAVIAQSVADIFAANCYQNGLVPVTLPEPAVTHVIARAARDPGYTLTVDLVAGIVHDAEGLRTAFAVDPFRRRCLLEGWDDIDLTLRHESAIAVYERRRGIAPAGPRAGQGDAP